MYAGGRGVTKDEVKAARWYRAAAMQGYVPAQYNLGLWTLIWESIKKRKGGLSVGC
jgi:TPR repeat protein